MNKHTAGPWRADDSLAKDYGTFGITILAEMPAGAADDSTTVRVADLPPGEVDAETRANARLIAAAPAMLEALLLLQAALTEHSLRDVRKRFSLCLADAAASKAIAQAVGLR